MKTQVDARFAGREVWVYEGKEISEVEARKLLDSLPDRDVSKVKKRQNGPHHNAKWAQHIIEKERRAQNGPLPFHKMTDAERQQFHQNARNRQYLLGW